MCQSSGSACKSICRTIHSAFPCTSGTPLGGFCNHRNDHKTRDHLPGMNGMERSNQQIGSIERGRVVSGMLTTSTLLCVSILSACKCTSEVPHFNEAYKLYDNKAHPSIKRFRDSLPDNYAHDSREKNS